MTIVPQNHTSDSADQVEIPAYAKEIRYARETRDYGMYLDGELVGYARTFQEAEVTLDALVFELLSKQPVTVARVAAPAEAQEVAPQPFAFTPGTHELNAACLQDAYVQALAHPDYQTPRWQTALNRGYDHLADAYRVGFRADGAYLWTPDTSTGGHYAVTPSVCQCTAFERGIPCRHRAAAAILSLYQPHYIYLFRFSREEVMQHAA